MGTTKRRKPAHCFIFKASWRGTALLLRIESNDLEYAYKRAETMILRMQGGSQCLSLECIKQEY